MVFEDRQISIESPLVLLADDKDLLWQTEVCYGEPPQQTSAQRLLWEPENTLDSV